jgi:8-oxo-dGTP pyrophosphatase MutT (NUDIX family)
MIPSRTVRPRDAATLIVVRHDGTGHRILMGRRHMGHKFMPGKYVFPGGGVDLADSRISPASDFAADVKPRLLKSMRGGASETRARALALAAIRETFEETGLAVGVPLNGQPRTSRSPAWAAFLRTGLQPALADLRLVARAITPPGRVRRFDTRFFAIDRSGADDLPFLGEPSDELEDVAWMSLDAARQLDLPAVTRTVIALVEERLALPRGLDAPAKIPFFFMRGRAWMTEAL